MEEALMKRVMPHSQEAEQSVIGAMIMSRDAIVEASEIITGQDFYQQQYGAVFEAMVELHDEGKAVDLVTLQERLREKNLPPEISDMEFMKDILSSVITSANVKYYAEIVAEKSMLRCLLSGTGKDPGYPGGHGEKDLRSDPEPGNRRLCSHPSGGAECHREDRKGFQKSGKCYGNPYRFY